MSPRNALSSVTFFGRGASRMAFTLFGQGFNPSLLMICPRYSIDSRPNLHFDCFKVTPAFSSVVNTLSRVSR